MPKRDRRKSVALKAERRLTAGLVHHRSPTFAPDGRWLAFAAGDGAGSSWVVTDRRGRVARTLPGPADGGASFAPDGALAFGRRVGALGEVWLAPAGGTPPVRLLGGDGQTYRDPAFSPDGRTLAFAEGTAPKLWLLDVASGERRPLDVAGAHPAFSPDGARLFHEGEDGALGVIDLAGGAPPERLPLEGRFARPAPLSADLLVAERQGDQASRLVLLEWRLGRVVDLTPEGRDQRAPSCARDETGKVRLAFTVPIEDGSLARLDVVSARLKGVGDAAAPARDAG